MLQYKHYLEIKINTKIINRDESSCLRIKSWVSLFMSMYNSIRKKKKERMVHTEVTACLKEMARSYLLLLL